MERPGERPRLGDLRRRRDPAPEPPRPVPVDRTRGAPVLDPDTARLDQRTAHARNRLARRRAGSRHQGVSPPVRVPEQGTLTGQGGQAEGCAIADGPSDDGAVPVMTTK